jgi:hypothetical protein
MSPDIHREWLARHDRRPQGYCSASFNPRNEAYHGKEHGKTFVSSARP